MDQGIYKYTLTGAGTEINNFTASDEWEAYYITGSAIAIANYSISITGTPKQGTTFLVLWNGTLDITTNSKTFSILGQSFTQNQLQSKLFIYCFYDGTSWTIEILPSFTGSVVETANIVNQAVTTAKIADSNVTTVKIANLGVTTAKIDNLAVTTGKITDNAVTNAKLVTVANQTFKGNISGGVANPSDISLSSLSPFITGFWSITGNSGLVAGTNFIGTTDNVDVVFKRGAIESGRIGLTNTSFGLGSLVSAGVTALDNIALGMDSLANLTTGDDNIGIGQTCGPTLTTGSTNTIIGTSADVSSATSSNRIALGNNAVADADNQFAIPDSVTKIKWRGLTYVLPSVQAVGNLHNDGSGNLTWA